MPDDKNLDDLSIDEVNELFNSVIEVPEEWKISAISVNQSWMDKYIQGDRTGSSC